MLIKLLKSSFYITLIFFVVLYSTGSTTLARVYDKELLHLHLATSSDFNLSEENEHHHNEEAEHSHSHSHQHSPDSPLHQHSHPDAPVLQLVNFELPNAGDHSIPSVLNKSQSFSAPSKHMNLNSYLDSIFRPPIS